MNQNIILALQGIKMKRLFCILSFIISVCSYGNTMDSLKFVSLQREFSNLKITISRLQQEDGRLKGLYQQQAKELDSLRAIQQQQTENVRMLADKVGADISDANQKIDKNVSTLSESISSRTWLGALGILITIGLLACTYYMLRRKINNGATTIDKIRSAQEGLESAQKSLQEESVKLDSKLVELLDKQLIQPHDNMEEEHKLVLSIATEVVRIEQNLAFMDSKTKGVSNLKNRASAIKATLQSRGYEIPTLIGETYNEGDNMKPTMELDEELPVGSHIIRRVMKPMVLFKGKLIQAAEVVVAYNE